MAAGTGVRTLATITILTLKRALRKIWGPFFVPPPLNVVPIVILTVLGVAIADSVYQYRRLVIRVAHEGAIGG